MARKTAKTNSDSAPKSSTKRAAPKKRAAASEAAGDSKRATKPKTASRRAAGDHALVIVESPKKAKSIQKFLGSGFTVKASMGHVRDLPEKGSDLGIDVANRYLPTYVVPEKKKATVNELKKEAAKAGTVFLATDPDREGEAIAWHLQNALGLEDDRVQRVLFYEITEKAVREAFQHAGPIDMNKVNAQQARRFLDRFVGYQVSPLLWKKVARGLSAGRVQSVAVRLIAQREKEIQAFVAEEFWRLTASLSPAGEADETSRFSAELAEWQGQTFRPNNGEAAETIRAALLSTPYTIDALETVEKLDRAEAPFKTSTLQQQAAIRLRLSGQRTMRIAQELYEGIEVDGTGPVGLITYMRTDSLRVSDDAITAVRAQIEHEHGPRYLPDKPNRYAAGKMAQEAHEAIRPTDLTLSPDKVKDRLSHDQYRLYNLIYRRFVASQMTPARFEVTNVVVLAGEGKFKTQGKILRFDGYRRVLPPAGKQEDALLPALHVGQTLDLHELAASQHFTQPPPRYSEATLIKALEKENIGRPSTYATIIQTIQDRGYVEQKDRRFFASQLGLVVTDLLVQHFPKILDVKFTAHLEDELDEIVTGKEQLESVLDEFYHPFQESLKLAGESMQKVPIPSPYTCPDCNAQMVMKFSKGRPFHSCSRYPECKGTRTESGDVRAERVESEHKCPSCGKPLLIRKNRRGEDFLSCSGYPSCKQSFNIGENGVPVPTVVETEHTCPKCGKPMALRNGARGAFLGCTGYPKCRSTMPVDDQGKPVAPVTVDVPCPKCGGGMGVKQGRRGAFLGCLNYPKCRGTAQVPDDLKESLGAAATTPAATSGPDLKTIEVEETCENCGGAMIIRRGRRGFFLGCASYPKCKGTKEPGDATKQKIAAALGEPVT